MERKEKKKDKERKPAKIKSAMETERKRELREREKDWEDAEPPSVGGQKESERIEQEIDRRLAQSITPGGKEISRPELEELERKLHEAEARERKESSGNKVWKEWKFLKEWKKMKDAAAEASAKALADWLRREKKRLRELHNAEWVMFNKNVVKVGPDKDEEGGGIREFPYLDPWKKEKPLENQKGRGHREGLPGSGKHRGRKKGRGKQTDPLTKEIPPAK